LSRLYSSTLEKKETKDELDDESQSILAVSANHVVINGRITEGGITALMPNRIKPIVFEDVLADEAVSGSGSGSGPCVGVGVNAHDDTHSTHELYSSSFPHKVDANRNDATDGLPESSLNGIKMASVEEAKELKGTLKSLPRMQLQCPPPLLHP